jgi:DNA-binding transcriptional LysR family regulator
MDRDGSLNATQVMLADFIERDIRKLVLSGRGLHLGPRWAFEDGLKDGRLRSVLPQYGLRNFPLHALYAPSAFLPAKSRLFIDMMAEAMASEASLA